MALIEPGKLTTADAEEVEDLRKLALKDDLK